MSDLADVAEMRLGWTSSAAEAGECLMVRVTDLAAPIDWGQVAFADIDPPNRQQYQLTDGDVLLARSGSIGSVQAVYKPPDAIFASYVIRLRPKPGWHGPYLSYYLKSKAGNEQLEQRAQGATIRNLSMRRLNSVIVPDLPLEQQIVVGSMLSEAERAFLAGLRHLHHSRKLLDEIVARTYTDAIQAAGLQEQQAAWAQTSLASVTESMDSLRSPLNASERSTRQGSTPYYGASGVIDSVEGKTHEGKHLLVSEDGNNLISRNTPIAFVVDGQFWANNHVHVLKVNDQVDAGFLALQINSQSVAPLLTGSAQPKLNKTALSRLPVWVPPLPEQLAVLNSARTLRGSYQGSLRKNEELQGLLNEAWDGLLTEAFVNQAQGDSTGAIERETLKASLGRLYALLSELDIPDDDNGITTVGASTTKSGSEDVAWTPVEDAFQVYSDANPAEDLNEAVDRFYDRLRKSIADASVEVRRNADGVFILGAP